MHIFLKKKREQGILKATKKAQMQSARTNDGSHYYNLNGNAHIVKVLVSMKSLKSHFNMIENAYACRE